MSAKLSALFAFAFGAIIGVAVGCQKYDFEPVSPIALSQTSSSYSIVAKKLKPNIMLVVDESGSMYLPINPSLPVCRFSDGGACGTDYTSPPTYCPSGCPTRTSELRRAMTGFFTDAGTVGRFGLTTFPYPVPPADGPWDTECNTGSVRVPISQSNDVDAELQATSNQILNVIQNDNVGGGTPTGATLRMLADNPGLQPQPGRDSFVLLETDGVPNCNPNNALNTCTNQVACACSGDICCGVSDPVFRRLNCLDQAETVNAITNLNANKNIKTIVLGLGDETAASAPTLNAMAEAGGFPLLCPDGGNGPCVGSNNSCVVATGKCAKEYYQANTGDELAANLKRAATFPGNPCKFSLSDTPSNPSLLSVIVDGQSIRPGPDTWSYNPPSSEAAYVLFTGSICTRLANATPGAPVNVDIRIVRTL